MKRFLCILISSALLSGLLGCGKKAGEYEATGNAYSQPGDATQDPNADIHQDQYLELVYYPDQSMHPIFSDSFTNRVLCSLVYQGLFAVDRNYNAVPILCSRFTMSDDMHSYTFYVAENATFSDGSPVTIADVLASLKAAQRSRYYGGRFTHIRNMALSADGGLTITLGYAMSELPLLLDIPIIKEAETSESRPLGSGPYKYEEAAAGLRLRRRMDWWCSAELTVTASSIPLVAVNSMHQVRDEFEFGDVGLTCADPCSDEYAEYRCDYELWDCENGTFLYVACNLESPVFSNPTVRSKLTHAIDRDMLAETYYRGFGQAATLPASPSSPFYNQKLSQRYGFDQAKFAQAITSGGYAGKEIVMLVNAGDSLRVKVAKEIAQDLEDCGLSVKLREVDPLKFEENLLYATWDLYVGQTRLSPNMDLSPFFRIYSSLDFRGMNDAGMYTLCLQALANRGNYYNLHEAVMEDGRLCPVLFHSYSVHSTRGLLTGLTPTRDNVFFYSLGIPLAAIWSVAEPPPDAPEPTEPNP